MRGLLTALGPADAVALTRTDTAELSSDEVFDLVTDAVAAERWAAKVHRRTDGHPFFARQLADPARPAGVVPAAVADLVTRRVERLSAGCQALVTAAAVAGNELLPDVLAEVCGIDPATVALLVEDGVQVGVLVRDADGIRTRLAYDLFRETLYVGLAVPQRWALHQRIADALEHRHARGAGQRPASSGPDWRSVRPPRTWPAPAGRCLHDQSCGTASGTATTLVTASGPTDPEAHPHASQPRS